MQVSARIPATFPRVYTCHLSFQDGPSSSRCFFFVAPFLSCCCVVVVAKFQLQPLLIFAIFFAEIRQVRRFFFSLHSLRCLGRPSRTISRPESRAGCHCFALPSCATHAVLSLSVDTCTYRRMLETFLLDEDSLLFTWSISAVLHIFYAVLCNFLELFFIRFFFFLLHLTISTRFSAIF